MSAIAVLGPVLAATLAVGGVTAYRRETAPETITVTAHFTRTVGLYPGSSVRVLGVKVGTVESLTPEGTTVRAVIELPADTPVPIDAKAVIVPPSLVSDRYVQLFPPYTGGARMPDGADIPVERTLTPVELDEILASIDRLLVAIGPTGANADGSFSELVDVGARALGNGNGERLNATISGLADAVGALADGRDDLGGVIENLAAFSTTLARNDAKVRSVTGNLGAVSRQLAAERDSLERALANLSVALGEVGDLVRTHRATLGADVQALAQITQTVLSNKAQLVEALDLTPLLLSNLEMAFNGERGTLDIRNNNEQEPTIDQILLCQLLGLSCSSPGASLAPASAKPDPLTLRGMLSGGTR